MTTEMRMTRKQFDEEKRNATQFALEQTDVFFEMLMSRMVHKFNLSDEKIETIARHGIEHFMRS